MSLFDVIKYGNTNLGSLPELQSLPLPLFKQYYEAIEGVYSDTNSQYYRSHALYTFAEEHGRKAMRYKFRKLLKGFEE